MCLIKRSRLSEMTDEEWEEVRKCWLMFGKKEARLYLVNYRVARRKKAIK